MGKVYYCVRKIARHLTLPAAAATAKAKLQLFHATFVCDFCFCQPQSSGDTEGKNEGGSDAGIGVTTTFTVQHPA